MEETQPTEVTGTDKATTPVEGTPNHQSDEGSSAPTGDNFKATREKYFEQGKRTGEKSYQEKMRAEFAKMGIVNEEGEMSQSFKDYLAVQEKESKKMEKNTTPVPENFSQDANYQEAIEKAVEQSAKNRAITRTGNDGFQKYGEEWTKVAQNFTDDFTADPQNSQDVLYAVAERPDSAEILKYLHENPSEYAKFKGMKPSLLSVSLANLSKNLMTAKKSSAADPLPDNKNYSQSSSSSGQMSPYEAMMLKKKSLKGG